MLVEWLGCSDYAEGARFDTLVQQEVNTHITIKFIVFLNS